MNTPIPIASLDVIGYATSLSEAMVPTIVTPVFRLRDDPETFLFPPFVIHCGQVCDGSMGSAEEFERFAARRKVTTIPDPFCAQRDHELWIDADMAPQYDPIDVADEKLGKISSDHINAAKLALKKGAVEEADQLAGVALCADDRLLEPLAIPAAASRHQGHTDDVELMALLAAPRYSQDVFDTMVRRYDAMIPTSDGPVYHVACVRPRDELEAA